MEIKTCDGWLLETDDFDLDTKLVKLNDLIFDLEFKIGMTITIQDYLKYLKELKEKKENTY